MPTPQQRLSRTSPRVACVHTVSVISSSRPALAWPGSVLEQEYSFERKNRNFRRRGRPIRPGRSLGRLGEPESGFQGLRTSR
jgi:hypothetical protein